MDTAPPPSYETATGSSESESLRPRNGIPPQSRRSMEDEARDLPEGWIRQLDTKTHHQFFVDTKSDPPRSIWHHPYDDEQYMTSLPASDHTRIKGLHRTPTDADVAAESTDEEDRHSALPPREVNKPIGIHKLGRKMKDKLTSSTHEEREVQRQKRAEQEEKLYAQHQHTRRCMALAMETGKPQLIGKDKQGRDVYIEPPAGYSPNGGYRGYGSNAYGLNPYAQGPYSNPNARYLTPSTPYSRPYGGGYGGGYGMPLGMMGLGLGGGLMAGSLLGGGLMMGGW